MSLNNFGKLEKNRMDRRRFRAKVHQKDIPHVPQDSGGGDGGDGRKHTGAVDGGTEEEKGRKEKSEAWGEKEGKKNSSAVQKDEQGFLSFVKAKIPTKMAPVPPGT